MTTTRELVDDISRRLKSFTAVQEQITYLTSPVDAAATVLEVAHLNRIIEGLIEVDDELVLVDLVQDTTIQLFPFGRGQNGTSATSHALNARVTNDPMFPRQDILKAVRETVSAMHPTLFRKKTTELTWNPAILSYELPSDVDRILQITYDTHGTQKLWPRAMHWDFNRDAAVIDFPSGKSISIFERIMSGLKVRIAYAAPFATVENFTQTLEDLGVPETASDVIIFGSCWRIVQMLESSRLQMESVEQFARQSAVQPGAITNFGRQLYAAYQQRLAEERARLLELQPRTIHYTR